MCRSRVADRHLQRREVRQVAIGIVLLIDGQDALGEIAQRGRQRGVGGLRGRLESEILRGRERRPHGQRNQEGKREQDFRCEGFIARERRIRSVAHSCLFAGRRRASLVRCSTRENSGRCVCVLRPM